MYDEEMNKERGFGELGVVRFRVGEQKTAKEGRDRRREKEKARERKRLGIVVELIG